MRATSRLLLVFLLSSGCTRKVADQPDAPDAQPSAAVSPVGNKAYVAPAARIVSVSRPDARARDRLAVPVPRDARSAAVDAKPLRSDAEFAAAAQAAAKAAVDKAVDQTISGSSSKLKACFDQASSKTTTAKIRLRVRAGYVITTDISGASDAVKSCLDQALRTLRFTGPAADASSVERKLEFTR